MTREKLLRRLVEVAPFVLASWSKEGPRCVLATACGVDLLQRFGVRAEPLAVRATVLNRGFLEWRKAGRVGDPRSFGAFCVEAGAPDATEEPGRWNGHLLVAVPTRGAVLDLDLRQFHRPEKGIRMPASAGFEWAPPYAETQFGLPGGVRLFLERLADRRFLESPDWARTDRRKEIVDELEAAVRKPPGASRRRA